MSKSKQSSLPTTGASGKAKFNVMQPSLEAVAFLTPLHPPASLPSFCYKNKDQLQNI